MVYHLVATKGEYSAARWAAKMAALSGVLTAETTAAQMAETKVA